MELKVTQIGNSLGVILPKELLLSLRLDKGDSLWASVSSEGFNVTPYDPEFAEQIGTARKIMKKRRNALRALAE